LHPQTSWLCTSSESAHATEHAISSTTRLC